MKVIIYGTMKTAQYVYNNLENVDIVGVVDGNIKKVGGMFHGYVIKQPKEIDVEKVDRILVCSNSWRDITIELKKMGIKQKLISILAYDNIAYDSIGQFREDPVYNCLNSKSREFYELRIKENRENQLLNDILERTINKNKMEEYPESLYEVEYSHDEIIQSKIIDYVINNTSIELILNNCFGYKNYIDKGLESKFIAKYNFAADCYPILCFLKANINNVKYSFDVGANRGFVSIFLSQLSEEVHAFEPSHETSIIAKKNIDINGVHNIIWNELGVAEKEKKLELNEYGVKASGHNSFIEQKSEKCIKTTSVNVVSLDKYCVDNNIQVIDILKIDVEGYEAKVLQGAWELLEKKRIKMIIFEISPELNYDKTLFIEMIKKLSYIGYVFFNLHKEKMEVDEVIYTSKHRDVIATIDRSCL